ncbi:Sua5/YciO/YrdC/YwlC family protein [Arsenophonus nasoniae]|uniref:Threonylcarbamoyl-AMP synthase n=1 Tax=Arsenophonus nasoniae TaxID=638 RepID=D2TVJ0_9GAMM|nr:Sua5/YciO/YrdC/YwlC family protein [Arsenophonus nasoniae]QBY45476.1 Threonylcarbamoyl-AMP synthase [Arsenophonus nasoniae]WGL95655.1 Sua5/YciO/YrdC/YwlC family protein [Arsenophonus nasoniae]WGM01131.1 Sua5/YciO/YrdC/YwlC family protein [Arsenophonus nasoniae]WGM05608.1 Sua5/YciO/YrdC/YwlC family protein [Arsenophonus nasoniae]WGM10620.1 Sua5/YciO/YrdC/YwlC family protein [Arsenophonus nasoniae]
MFDEIPPSFRNIIAALNEGKIIAYPTEAVFGLGCDPDNEKTVRQLLLLKQRSWKKGLILIAGDYEQLIPYIDDNKLTNLQKEMMLSTGSKSITWVVPARKNTPKWLTGKFDSIAVRITNFELIKKLCFLYGKPLISTSANLNGLSPCRTKEEVIAQFNGQVSVLDGSVGGRKNPSEIRDIITGHLYRKG